MFKGFNKKKLAKDILRSLIVVVISVSVLYFALAVRAGSSLDPIVPLGTASMRSLEEIYSVLTGNYDSSTVSADENGNALEILKCITNKIDGGTCP